MVGLLMVVIALCCYVQLGCGSGSGVNTSATQSPSTGPNGTSANGNGNSSADIGSGVSNGSQPQFLISAEVTFSGTRDDQNDYEVFRFDPVSGTLTPVVSYPSGCVAVTSMAVHPNSQWVYTTEGYTCPNFTAPYGEVFSLDSISGALSPIPGAPFWPGTFGNGVVVHPNGQFVYYSEYGFGNLPGNDGQGGMAGFSIGANGAPAPLPGSPFSAYALGSNGMAITSDGRFLFAVPQNLNDTNTPTNSLIYTFAVNVNSGALSQIAVNVVGPSAISLANAVHVAPSGDYVYVASDSAISVFQLNQQTGQMTPVPGSPFPSVTQLTSFAMSPNGRFLYAAGCVPSDGCRTQGFLETYAVDPTTGQITPLGSPSPLPGNALIAASGTFVFAATGTSTLSADETGDILGGAISIFSVDPTTGALTLKGITSTTGAPFDLLAIPAQ